MAYYRVKRYGVVPEVKHAYCIVDYKLFIYIASKYIIYLAS